MTALTRCARPTFGRRALTTLTVLALLAGAVPLAAAQINPARLQGSVLDESGEPVGKLELLFEPADATTTSRQKVKVGKKGRYMVAFFPSGRYRISLPEGDQRYLKSLKYSVRDKAGLELGSFASDADPDRGLPPIQVIAGSVCQLDLVALSAEEGRRFKQQVAAFKSKDELAKLMSLYEAGDMQGVLAESEAVLAKSPDLGSAHQMRGIALARLGRYDEAETGLRRAVELLPGEKGVKGSLGTALLEHANQLSDEGKNDRAQALYVEAAELFADELDAEPGSVGLLTNRAIALDRAGRADEAVAVLESLIEADPENVAAYFRLASMHTSAGRTDEAVEVLGRLPETDKEGAKAIYNVATTLYNDKRYDAARLALDKAVQIDPELAPAYRLRAYVHLASGNTEAGKADLARFLELDPGHPDAPGDRQLLDSLGP